jgi:hypothetical protein
MAYASMAESTVENSAQVLSCWLKFVNAQHNAFVCETQHKPHSAQMTLSITISSAKCRYAECSVFIVMLSVIMLNDIMLNVVMLNVVMLNVVMLNVVMLNAVMLNVIMLNAVMLNVVMLNVVMMSVVAPKPETGLLAAKFPLCAS